MNDLVMNVDSLSGIMEFSKVKERRNLSCVSSLFKETFDKSMEECTRIATRGLVEERRERYEFPIVTSKEQTIRECLPKKFDMKGLVIYLAYQAISIIRYEFDWETDEEFLTHIIKKEKFMFSIFMKIATLRLFQKLSSKKTLRILFLELSHNKHPLYMEEPSSIEIKKPVWYHVDGLFDVHHEPEDEDVLTGSIKWVLNLIEDIKK